MPSYRATWYRLLHRVQDAIGRRFSWPSCAFWVALCSACLIASACAVFSATWGNWRTHVLGTEYQFIWDPGGLYLGTALTFFDERFVAPGTGCSGHPGLPLMFLLHALARALYWLAGSAYTSFIDFAAANLHHLARAGRLMTTLLHLLSFYTVYLVARQVLGSRATALAGTAIYATNFLVLIYLANISVEPLLVSFTALTFLWSRSSLELATVGRHRAACIRAALCAAACALAFYTKLLIVAPLVVVAPCYLLIEAALRGRGAGRRYRSYVAPIAIFAIVFAGLMLLGARMIDWNKFFGYWSQIGPVRSGLDLSAGTSGESKLTLVVSLLSTFADRLTELIDPATWEIGFGKRDHAYIAELPVNVLAAIGLALLWWRRKQERRQLAWLVLFALSIAPMIAFKRMWHYYVLYYAAAGPLAAYALVCFYDKVLTRWRPGSRSAIYAAVTGLLLHYLSFALAYDARSYDAEQYRRWQPYYEAIDRLEPGQQIGLVRGPAPASIAGRITDYMPADHPIVRRFEGQFVKLRRPVKDLDKHQLQLQIERDRYDWPR
jgi:hypothetical protein